MAVTHIHPQHASEEERKERLLEIKITCLTLLRKMKEDARNTH